MGHGAKCFVRRGPTARQTSILWTFIATIAAICCLSQARKLSDVQASLSNLPCSTEELQHGCLIGKSETSYVISALHDPTLHEVAVFGDFSAELFSKNEEENVANCSFWSHDSNAEPSITESATLGFIEDSVFKYAPYVVKCQDPLRVLKEVPRWAGVIINGKDVGARVPVQQVSLNKKGELGACVAPIFSEKFELMYEWLNHHADLGVSGFDIYWTDRLVSWDKTKTEVTNTLKPFAYPSVTWRNFQHFTEDERYYYSQQTVYNDCVYRNRHAYDYMLMFDIDEFLVIADERYKDDGKLVPMLKHLFHPHRASVGVYRYAYRRDCDPENAEYSGNYHMQYTHREVESESKKVVHTLHYADKLIIKPLWVDTFYVHYLASARQHYTPQMVNAQPSMLYLKHLRKYDNHCEDMTTDAPYDKE